MRKRTELLVWLVPITLLLLGVAVAVWPARSSVPLVVAAVPPGDQEVVWIAPNTSGIAWERFVAGIRQAAKCQRDRTAHAADALTWMVDDSAAYRDSQTEVAEVAIVVPGTGRLRFRWYKLSSEYGFADWVAVLAQRRPAPLVFVGGGSSDLARDLAVALRERTDWQGERPLLLLTTATANYLDPVQSYDPLMQIYPGRTFRFCFTNQQMASAVLDFIEQSDDLQPRGDLVPLLALRCAAIGQPLPAATLLAQPPLDPPLVFPVEWDDDPYSIDLCVQFRAAISGRRARADGTPWQVLDLHQNVPYSVGGYYRANPREAEVADALLRHVPQEPLRRSVLLLPAAAQPSRRLLRALLGSAPLIGRHLVAVTGDSISLNTVLRDGDFAWNVRVLPVPLVLFAHQNPVAWSDDAPPPTGTDDLLLHADLVRLLIEASYSGVPPRLLDSADELRTRLSASLKPATSSGREDLRTRFFDDEGNRADGGAYVICLRPRLIEQAGNPRVGPPALLTVYRQANVGHAWEAIAHLEVDHGRTPRIAGRTRP